MSNGFKSLPAKPGRKEIGHLQASLPFKVEKQSEIEGIGMGVLNDGTPFLNQRGLARLAGVENAHIGTISSQWDDQEQKPRITTIKELLRARGIEIQSPHLTLADGGRTMFAYPDYVALAILEYYAFEAGTNVRDEAVKNFRILAGNGLREFIYTQVGYSPRGGIPLAWQEFHDRVTSAHGTVPKGYFSVFKEASDLIVTLIRNGANVGQHFVPDGSIGQHWAAHWNKRESDLRYGKRIQYPHSYPDYFAQARSNPQPAYCYPNGALAEFRKWMDEVYLPEKLPTYLKSKAAQGMLPASLVELALITFKAE